MIMQGPVYILWFILAITFRHWAGNNNAEPPNAFMRQHADSTVHADSFSLNGKWYLQPVLASDTATGQIPFLNFNIRESRFTGHTGCNNMSGKFTLTDTSLFFNEEITLTKVLCPGYNEGAFVKNLLRTNRYSFDSGVLVLFFNQTELSRWTRKVDTASRKKVI
jgi:heat shock protein HslJ